MLCPLLGGVAPFAATREERMKTGDPRPSLEERYRSSAEYVAKVDAAARGLVAGAIDVAGGLAPSACCCGVADTLAKLRPPS